MKRETLVGIQRETGQLLELKRENPFRVRAYENAARALEGLAEEPEDAAQQVAACDDQGVGECAKAGAPGRVWHLRSPLLRS